jgi:Tol biopolymer transport system component
VNGGGSSALTVSNADGTDVVQLYSTRNITGGMKFAPTDNRIVFEEVNAIKVLTYAVSSNGVSVTSITTVTNDQFQPLHIDVSPDGTQLLFIEKTATPSVYAIYVMSISGGTKTLVTSGLYIDAVWANSNSRIAAIQGAQIDGGTQTVQVYDLDVNYSIINTNTVFTTTLAQLYQLSRLESGHAHDILLFSASGAAPVWTGHSRIDRS